MQGQELQVIYNLGTISPLDAWKAIYEFLVGQGVSPSAQAELNGKKIVIDEVFEDLRKKSLNHFQIEINDMSLGYSPVTNWEHILISIKDQSHSKILDWDKLVTAIFLKQASFIQAWVSDIEYAFWQNADDPLEYEARGKSYKGLPMKSNGLPPPLEQMSIDTSQNPSRRVIKLGYVEAIGSCMWFSNKFWLRVGTKKDVAIQEFINEYKLVSEGVMRFKFLNEPFTEATSSQLQEKIRNVLFNQE